MSKTTIENIDGIAHLVLNDPDEKLNTLGSEMLAEIPARLDELEADDTVKAVVIRSTKKGGFIAGANIAELKGIALGGDAFVQGTEAARVGQRLMDKIEDFSKPVVAAVHGACLGGGMELALACHARVVAKDPKTKMGLPELKLGIMPGFGGTFRLPKVVGLMAGMSAILASSNFDSRKAYKSGLADDIAPLAWLEKAATEMAQFLLKPGAKKKLLAKRKAKWNLVTKLTNLPLLGHLVMNKGLDTVMFKTGGNYPAPLRFIKQLKWHYFRNDREAAMDEEAIGLGETLDTAVSRNLLGLFFLGQDAKKQGGDGKVKDISYCAIVGSGFMGSSIAIPAIYFAGWQVQMKDAKREVIGRALGKAHNYIQKWVKRRKLTRAEGAEKYNRLSGSVKYAGFQNADIVIEAVPEVLDFKHTIFAEVEAETRPDAILASNTSTLPIDDITAKAKHPERFIGMHFFSPAEIMPLVEIIPGSKTSADTIATTVAATLAMGKTPVVVKDSPGFLVNRILLPYIGEACQMVSEGVAVEQIDRLAVKFGMPMGPIRLMGEVGIPVIVKVFHILMEHFGDHMPSPQWLEREDLESAFPRNKKKKIAVNGAKIAGWVGKKNPGLSDEDVADRLFQAMLNEAARCMDEGVVQAPGMLDLAMIYGTGFPPFRGGVLREADTRGLKAVVERSKVLADQYGAHLSAPEGLLKALENGSFYQD